MMLEKRIMKAYSKRRVLDKVEGCTFPPHHEKFQVDEDYMKYGAALHVQFALDFLNENQ